MSILIVYLLIFRTGTFAFDCNTQHLNLNPIISTFSTPQSLRKLQKDALIRTTAACSYLTALSTSCAAVASSPKCICGDPLTCNCEPGQREVAGQIEQINQGYFYNPRNERIYDTTKKSFIPAHPEVYLAKELGLKNVIVVGEIHSNRCHHHAEFEIVRAMAEDCKKKDREGIAIGLECFYRQHQTALDNFIFSHRNMGQLKKETNWQNTWGYDLNYYAKIFNYAAKNQIRLVGLNVPYQVVQMVGINGFEKLPPSLKRLLPKLDLNNVSHRQQFVSLMGASGDIHQMNSAAMQNMYEAQTLWDEYMAESAANYARRNPNQILLVIAGAGHVLGRTGIPNRIKGRLGKDPFVILPQQVGWSVVSGLPNIMQPLTSDDADWAWYTE